MTISEMLLPEFDHEMSITRKFLAIVPMDKADFAPHAKSMKLGRLASHVAEAPGWATFTITMDVLELTPDQKPFLATSTEELLAAFDKNVAGAHEALAGATDEHLAQNWKLVYGGHTMFDMPRVSVLRSMVLNHVIHHRAQLGVYLRMNDVAVPSTYGPSADDRG